MGKEEMEKLRIGVSTLRKEKEELEAQVRDYQNEREYIRLLIFGIKKNADRLAEEWVRLTDVVPYNPDGVYNFPQKG